MHDANDATGRSTAHPGLAALLAYPLIASIRERRTRRVSRGTSIIAGALSHQSQNKPAPLSPLEEAILIVSTGLTGGTNMHDVPLQTPAGGKELGTPMSRVLARSAASGDNIQATSFFLVNDEGTWLIQQPKGVAALAMLRGFPPKWEDWSENDWLSAARAVKLRLFDKRIEFPREWPYYLGWNKQLSNVPGSTVFIPVVNLAYQMINVLLFILSEPDGQRPLVIDDWQKFRPRTLVDFVAKVASSLGFVQPIPYQPIGGIKRVRSGFVNPEKVAPLGLAGTMQTDSEAMFHMQNLMLMAQAMGLGGYLHASVPAPFLFQRDAAKGIHGLGFRFEDPKKKLKPWPPLPSTQPNPVGIDGILEGHCPPYVKSMNDVVDKVIADKYGSQGMYRPDELFKLQYRTAGNAETFVRTAQTYSKESIQYVKDICNYIYDTYGRFPAHVNAFHTPGLWLQIHHVEVEYYEKYFDPALYGWQAQHDSVWGKH
jgi:hypothetical protein